MPIYLAMDTLVGLRFFSADSVLSPYVFVFYAAYIVAFLFTPVMRRIAVHYQIIDQPDGLRKMHKRPVAYLGGVAVFLGWICALALSQFLRMHRVEEGLQETLVVKFGIVLGACLILLVGLLDDIYHIPPWGKILGQAIAAMCLLGSGIGTRCAWIFAQPILVRTKFYFNRPALFDPADPTLFMDQYGHILTIASWIFVIAIVLACCNSSNLLDGLDGLCGGVTAIVSFGFVFLAVHLAMNSGAINVNQDALRVVLGLALLGGVLGFVPFNFNPASIFMGDTGSMFLGFACATMMVLFASEGHFKWFLASTVMFSLPFLDTALAFVRRWVNGRPIFSADRHHFHHQLVARGFSIKQTVLISYGLALIFCLLGAAIVYMRTRYAVGIYLVVFGSIIVAAYKMGMVHERVRTAFRKPPDQANPPTPLEVEPNSVLDVKNTGASSDDRTRDQAAVAAQW
jgi:UDP-GlcNAc:undecaprenyl-phosphate GlcNAc-1-phosphate transferase